MYLRCHVVVKAVQVQLLWPLYAAEPAKGIKESGQLDHVTLWMSVVLTQIIKL